MQNEEHAEFLNLLADDSGAHFETAGSLKNGRQVFLTMKMPESLAIGGMDRVDLYIAASNGHDGRQGPGVCPARPTLGRLTSTAGPGSRRTRPLWIMEFSMLQDPRRCRVRPTIIPHPCSCLPRTPPARSA
ncbi:DUF932 domain-containing protein [Streptomyces sp. CA-106110]|uniref:DUF932 domain-containing protein n=1 Tax=Streptomyces sp. CA-106110 TaxID=3240044 RepID=UPI003D918A1C